MTSVGCAGRSKTSKSKGVETQAASPMKKCETCRRSLVRVLGTLSRTKKISSEVLHKMRVDLRWLQAWFELNGDPRSAVTLGKHISLVSPLRTMQVLEGWLIRRNAPSSDLRKVGQASRDLAEKRVFQTIREAVTSLSDWDRSPDPARQRKAWRRHLDSCVSLLSALSKTPKRKRLHALRPELRQLRYQLGWVMDNTGRHERLIEQLKQAQRCLGENEEQAAFRKLTKRLDLQSRAAIVKRWRRARKTACALSRDMSWLPASLRHLVRDETGPPRNKSPKRVNVDVTSH